MIALVRRQRSRSRVLFAALLVLCLLGRPLLAVASDLHDMAHHDALEFVHSPAGGETLPEPDGESLLHDILHLAHCCGPVVAIVAVQVLLSGDPQSRSVWPRSAGAACAARVLPLLRPPIFA